MYRARFNARLFVVIARKRCMCHCDARTFYKVIEQNGPYLKNAPCIFSVLWPYIMFV